MPLGLGPTIIKTVRAEEAHSAVSKHPSYGVSFFTMLLDSAGTLASLLSTYYFIRLDNKAWTASLLAICLNGWLYWKKGIYADMVLESFYFFSTCYGWYLWYKPIKPKTQIIKLSKKQSLLIGFFILALYILIVNLLTTFTDSNVAVLDALTTALSLAAQGLMCYKAIATWMLWFITDAIYAYMYLHKQLPFHSLLMLIYTLLAVVGYFKWAKQEHPAA